MSRETHINVYAGIAVPKGALYVKELNFAIDALKEFGIIQHIFFKDVPLK